MTKELLFSFGSPSRDDLVVYGFRFGKAKEGAPKVAIVSGLNGEEIAGVFVASQLVRFLEEKERENPDFLQGEILIVPSVNHFALNMGKRFWPLDNTDINVMFPGYDKGETTQRIAHKLFEAVKDVDYGIVIEDRKDKADCMPYIKLVESGFEDIEGAKAFGLALAHLKHFEPIDSGSLLYNWGVWGTKSYSVVFSGKGNIFKKEARNVIDSIVRFLSSRKVINFYGSGGYQCDVVARENIYVLKASCAGIFKPYIAPGARVKHKELLGTVYDSLCGAVREEIYAPCDGVLSCMYSYPLIFEHTVAFRIVKFDGLGRG